MIILYLPPLAIRFNVLNISSKDGLVVRVNVLTSRIIMTNEEIRSLISTFRKTNKN
jgi:hypothetical protein